MWVCNILDDVEGLKVANGWRKGELFRTSNESLTIIAR
jgi:hypothetical protein